MKMEVTGKVRIWQMGGLTAYLRENRNWRMFGTAA
jgi:hypothetical protein